MSTRFRYTVLIGLLALAAVISLWPRPAPDQADEMTSQALHAYHVDVAGWYVATPDERVVYARFPLSMSEVASSLPTELDRWRSTELGTDDDIERWFEQPELVVRRKYTAPGEPAIWLTAIGSTGAKSFHIFEHTPSSCYPSADWSTLSEAVAQADLADGALPVNRAIFRKGETTRLVYYWYLWDSPTRDATEGVTTWRISTDAPDGIEAAEECLTHFLRLMFQQSIVYHRF